MEFILFLSKIDKEIIELINKSNHSIEENTALCLIDRKYVGFFKRREKAIVICTKNAKKLGGYREDKKKSINLMKIIDSLNQKFNNNAITWAITKKSQEWAMNRNSLSPVSTTDIKKIPIIVL